MNTHDDFLQELRQITGQRYEPASGRGRAFLLLDVSGSMAGAKLNQAKSGAEGYASQAMTGGYEVGLISFGSAASLVSAPVDDLDAITRAANALTISGDTNMTAAFEIAIAQLAGYDGSRAICVVTDGAPNDERGVIAQATYAKSDGIHITARGTDDANLEFLRRISSDGDLAEVVEPRLLSSSMRDAARLLPAPRRRRLG